MKALTLVLCCALFSSCSVQTTKNTTPLRWVDDIPFDPETDDPSFELCGGPENVYQYFNDSKGLLYKGGKPAIDSAFAQNYAYTKSKGPNALIRIRFIVNCDGKADRYRLLCSDLDYQPTKVDSKVTDQLMKITQSLDGWEVKHIRGGVVSYYQYLVFRIENGQLKTILP